MKKGYKKVLFFLAGGFAVKLAVFLLHRKNYRTVKTNWIHFMHAERREIRELVTGREGLRRYVRDTGSIFRDYFLPHRGNGFHPHILRRRQLAIIAILLLIVKVAAIGYVFFIYPNDARLAEITVNRILELTNKSRTQEGLAEVRIDPTLAAAAQAKAEDMLRAGYFAHYGPDGKKPWDWIDRGTYAYLFVGENLAMNFTSAESAHEALMASPSHQANILNERWRDVGLAVATGEMNGQKTTVLVEMFAVRRSPSLAIASAADTQAGTTPKAAPAAAMKPSAEPVPALPSVTESAPKAPVPDKTSPAAIPAAAPENAAMNEALPEPPPALPDVPAIENTDTVADTAVAGIETVPAAQPELTTIEYPEFALAATAGSAAFEAVNPDPNLPRPENNRPVYRSAHDRGLPAEVIRWSQWILIAGLLFIIAALIMHMVYRAEIEHKSVVVDALFLAVFVVALISTRIHLLEAIGDVIVLL